MTIDEFKRKSDADEMIFIKEEIADFAIAKWYIDKKTGKVYQVRFSHYLSSISIPIPFDDLDDDMRKAKEEWEVK
jgi:hypothetical protein